MRRTVAKSAERELRDLLERTQAEVQRLKAELATRERTGNEAALQSMEQELQALRERARTLEQENAALRVEYAEASAERTAVLEAEVVLARKDASQAQDEAQRLKKQLEATSWELRKARVLGLKGEPREDSLLGRVREFFSRGNKQELARLSREYEVELERAQKEITRLQQKLSLSGVQVKRRGR